MLYVPPGILGIICNVVVLIGIIGSRLWTRNQYLLIINLCVCDLLYATWWTVCCVALYDYSNMDVDVYRCLEAIFLRFYYMLQMSTVLTIVMMAIGQNVTIVQPLWYQLIMSRRRMVACIIVTWATPLIINLIMIVITLAKSEEGLSYGFCDDVTRIILSMQILGVMVLCPVPTSTFRAPFSYVFLRLQCYVKP